MEILSSHPVAVDHFESRFRCWQWAGFPRGRRWRRRLRWRLARLGWWRFWFVFRGWCHFGLSLCILDWWLGFGNLFRLFRSFFRLSWILKSIALPFLRHDDLAGLRARASQDFELGRRPDRAAGFRWCRRFIHRVYSEARF